MNLTIFIGRWYGFLLNFYFEIFFYSFEVDLSIFSLYIFAFLQLQREDLKKKTIIRILKLLCFSISDNFNTE